MDAGRGDLTFGRVDRADLESLVGPVMTPEAVHPDPFVDAPSRRRIARIFERAALVAVFPFAGRLVDRFDAAINDRDNLRPPGIRPTRQTHRFAAAEDLHLSPAAEFIGQRCQGCKAHARKIKRDNVIARGFRQT